MKLKIGSKLQSLREEKKLTQADFASILNLSTSAYQRIERNEARIDVEQLIRWSETLEVPIQEFLPDSITFHNNNQGQVGVIFGPVTNNNYYASDAQAIQELRIDIENMKQMLNKISSHDINNKTT